jgi:methionyl-tRNA synthetase
MDQALKVLPADYWRYYLIASAPESGDADFSWKTFAATVNADLADNFGNFVNRTLKFLASKFEPTIPRLSSPSVSDEALLTALAGGVKEYTGHLEKLQFRKAVNELRSIWSLGNNFLNRRAPWKGIKTDPAEASDVLFAAVNLIRIYAVLAAPIIPKP